MDWLLQKLLLASPWELAAVALALAYVVLAVWRNMWCWLAAIVSSGIYVALLADKRLYMEAALNAFYVAMAVYGYWSWQRGRDAVGAVAVARLAPRAHVLGLLVVVAVSLLNGWLLSRFTDGARPYVDSLVTWSSVFATWLVARRVLENWLYWIAIDSVAALLYFDRQLAPTAVLFLIYTAISIHGYFVWRRADQANGHRSIEWHAAR